ncbi:cathepsin L-like [Phymastichus coffea]|uniref:cathepsin L-like n=1 Tax=Phymastichus coffea TaxID=108790 RepID=UPI00273A9B52|nr:cathepsin L-like [Phymastichus coffea]
MKTLVVLLVAFIAVAQAVSIYNSAAREWNTFKAEHGKSYTNEIEEKSRLKIFMEHKQKIAEHNAMFEQGLVTYKLGLNKYSDMIHHEFVRTMNGFNKSRSGIPDSSKKMKAVRFASPAHVQLPASVDWRKEGAVTNVKDQGFCGSCWSFSATGALEGQHFRKTGKLVSLSEQNLLDCSGSYGNYGCDGGIMQYAFNYIKDNKGIDTEKTYPYEASEEYCRYDPRNSGAEDVGFVDIRTGDEQQLMEAVATIGPIAVAMDASHLSFQNYRSGIYYEPKCKNKNDDLDHGVLIVGYGTTENGINYWLVKNSWGDSWGENGYFKIPRNKNNHCGIATDASYPLV